MGLIKLISLIKFYKSHKSPISSIDAHQEISEELPPVAAPEKNEKRAAQCPTSFQIVEASGKGRLGKPPAS